MHSIIPRAEAALTDVQEWSEEDSEDDDSQQPISREDSGIQLDRTPQEDQDGGNKALPAPWTGEDRSHRQRRDARARVSGFVPCVP